MDKKKLLKLQSYIRDEISFWDKMDLRMEELELEHQGISYGGLRRSYRQEQLKVVNDLINTGEVKHMWPPLWERWSYNG